MIAVKVWQCPVCEGIYAQGIPCPCGSFTEEKVLINLYDLRKLVENLFTPDGIVATLIALEKFAEE